MRLFYFLITFSLFLGCKKQAATPENNLTENVDTSAMKIASGVFQNGPYGAVMGNGHLFKNYNGSYSILLDSFTTSNGPALHVYLSKEAMPVNFIDAGNLKSTNGMQVYDLPTSTDILSYKYICIHCKDYNHLFGYAQLK